MANKPGYPLEVKRVFWQAVRPGLPTREPSAVAGVAIDRSAVVSRSWRTDDERVWVRQAEVDGGVRPGTTTEDATRIAELEGGP